MNRFSNIHNLNDLTDAWRQTAKRMHPDVGGNTEEFKNAYEEYMRRKSEIETELATAQRREHNMAVIGAIGSILTKVSRDEDWIGEIKKLVPEKHHQQIDIISTILKTNQDKTNK